jgi:hypothetical protein
LSGNLRTPSGETAVDFQRFTIRGKYSHPFRHPVSRTRFAGLARLFARNRMSSEASACRALPLGDSRTASITIRNRAGHFQQWHSASEEDRARVLTMIFPMFKIFENAWFQHHQGTLNAQQWEGPDLFIRMYYDWPGLQT